MVTKERVHFIGIGGIGMSSLAMWANRSGMEVSGSDIKENAMTRNLEAEGVKIQIPHRAENVPATARVIYSSAINESNPEMEVVQHNGMKSLHRSEFLAELLAQKKGICITGCHGKTTTTALTSHILTESGWDPTCLIGGIHPQWKSNFRHGGSPYAVVEADESDGTMVRYQPFASVVTNVDDDHMDFYKTTAGMVAAYQKFLGGTQADGVRIVFGDQDPLFSLAMESHPSSAVTFGFLPRNTFSITNVRALGEGGKSHFSLTYKGMPIGDLLTPLKGEHNLLNCAAAAVATLVAGTRFSQIQSAMATFTGVKRRAEILFQNETVTLMDDYAHHPTAVRVTLEAIKGRAPGRLVVIFQPHRYSRTANLFKDFANSLQSADKIYLCPIYSAGESPIEGIDSRLILENAPITSRKKIKLVQNLDQAMLLADQDLMVGDTLLSMGAGDVRTVVEKLSQKYSGTLPLAVSSQ